MGDRVHRALLVGNSTFPEDPHNLPDLNGPVNDLALLRDALSDDRWGLFDPSNVRLLPERTKAEITRAMEEFFLAGGPDDLLLLYYSGHGMQDEFDNLYLCARDTRTDLLRSSAISDAEVNGVMQASSTQTFVVVLDCCNSGAFKSAGLPSNLKGTGRFLLTSSRRGQSSRDTPEVAGPSAFTRYLSEGLRLGSLDSNRDGYVSLNEIYDYTLTKLREDTKQIPQRHLDKTVGDVALARSSVIEAEKAAAADSDAREQGPVLGVSESSVEILNVAPGEELRSEVIDVFNTGGGDLQWSVESLDDWITVEQCEGFFTMTFKPGPGINRGRVRVRSAGGEVKTVRVLVQVDDKVVGPRLHLSQATVDFGTVSVGSEPPVHTVQLLNSGAGYLNARATTTADWLQLRDYGGSLELRLDTSAPGERSGVVAIDSDGGRAEIKVAARVERGPVLAVEPSELHFGRVSLGASSEATVRVSNAGHGELTWDYGSTGDFFVVERAEAMLTVRLVGSPGHHVGSIWVRSNGGEQTLSVTADVVAGSAKPATINGKAMAGTLLGLVLLWPVALILGYVARREIRKTGGVQKGRGLATTAIWLGWIGLVVSALLATQFAFVPEQQGFSANTRAGFIAECTSLGIDPGKCGCLVDEGQKLMTEQEFVATRSAAFSGFDTRWVEMERRCGF